MKLIILSLIFNYVSAFDCSQYSTQGCKGCVANVNTLTDGCVWCGFVDTNDGYRDGNCYLYADLNQACQNVKNNVYIQDPSQIYTDINLYNCCNQQFRIGSNSDITCSGNFTNIVTAESNKLLLIYFIYFWAMGFIAIFYILTLWKRGIIYSFITSTLFPIMIFAIFFYDVNLNPQTW